MITGDHCLYTATHSSTSTRQPAATANLHGEFRTRVFSPLKISGRWIHWLSHPTSSNRAEGATVMPGGCYSMAWPVQEAGYRMLYSERQGGRIHIGIGNMNHATLCVRVVPWHGNAHGPCGSTGCGRARDSGCQPFNPCWGYISNGMTGTCECFGLE